MKPNFFFLFLLVFLLAMTFTSCERKKLLLDIEFGLNESQVKEEAVKLAKKKYLIMEVKNEDTTFYRNLKINGSTYNCMVYFNGDRLKTGPLRTYEYILTTLPYAETGNDTIDKDGNKLSFWKVFKISDFENLKSFLDNKYGKGVFSTEKGILEKYSVYKYVTENVDLFLHHGKKEDIDFYGVPLKTPFYSMASLEVKSKTYNSDFKKENEKRKNELKPEDILTISFDAPYLSNDFDEFGHSVYQIVLKANREYYWTFVIDDDVTECKGILSITDAYQDTIKKAELIYKFNSPLRSPKKQNWREINYNSYSIKWTDPAFDKISNMIKSGSTLKVNFAPTAVVLSNGNVIK
ncbi:hypothetical protein OAB20_00320 [Winogradskyella sp.]|nr:hypothetical protein [Winogradskyella sp.]